MPIDRGVIDQQLQELRESQRWWEEREFRDLPSVLRADEQIMALSRGRIARPRLLRRSWLIVVTDSRLLCLRSRRRGWRQIEIGADQIERVSIGVGVLSGRVHVLAAGQRHRLVVPRQDAYKLLKALAGLGTPAREAVSGFGPTRVVKRVVSHMLALPTVALGPTDAPARSLPAKTPEDGERVHMLEDEIQELRQQVTFLEQLLRERQTAAAITPARDDADTQ